MPLILQTRGIFDNLYDRTFQSLNIVIGFLAYFEYVGRCGCILMELADSPLLECHGLPCSMSYDASEEYDWVEGASPAFPQYKVRKAAALQKVGYKGPTQTLCMSRHWDSSLSCGRDLHSMKDLNINDLVGISRVRREKGDEHFFLGPSSDNAMYDHYWWRVSACNESTIFKATPQAAQMLAKAGVTNQIILADNLFRAVHVQ